MIALNKLVAIALPALLLAGCELGPKEREQLGYRGTGLVQITDPDNKAKVGDIPAPPYELTAEMLGGQKSREAYENVQVLGDVSVDEFNYLMQAMTTWVAPDGSNIKDAGCTYCHNPENMASDEKYTKVVARSMLQMTRKVNAGWKPHFGNQENGGVTCWTCHRGNPVPLNNWSQAVPNPNKLMGNKRGGNTPAPQVGYASLNYDPFSDYLAGNESIRAEAKVFPTSTSNKSIQNTEKTYGLMMHMSQGLGVNCAYCHNSNNFGKWTDSRPQRVNAWYGIRMVRDINNNYITSLGNVWPANGQGPYGNRRGPHGDPLKVNCATCHQGISKPLGGYKMLKDYPALKGDASVNAPVVATAAPADAPAPAAAETAAAATLQKPAA